MNSVFRFAKVSKDVIEIAKGIVKNNGYTFVGMTRKSNLPNMSNYYIVVGQGGYKNGFCVWNFEDVRGIRKDEKGYLSSGVYDLTFAEMLAEVKERVIENYDSDDADAESKESESNVAEDKICSLVTEIREHSEFLEQEVRSILRESKALKDTVESVGDMIKLEMDDTLSENMTDAQKEEYNALFGVFREQHYMMDGICSVCNDSDDILSRIKNLTEVSSVMLLQIANMIKFKGEE